MPRYRLTLAYDGSDFCGWQKQEPIEASEGGAPEGVAAPAYSARTPRMESTRAGRVALRTVQGVVEQAVREVVREPIEVLGASRTDSGVHAQGQVAAFTCSPLDPPLGDGEEARARAGGWPLSRGHGPLVAALNSRLPDDVMVLDAQHAAPDFDPIGGARSKGYAYTMHVSRERPLWDRRYVHHVYQPRVDAGAMHEAARVLLGEHDFAAFAAAGHGRLSTVRTVHTVGVREVECTGAYQRVRIDVSGDGFLWNMVRIVAGTLLQVGLGQRTPADVAAALASRDRARAGPTLPPHGLCLLWVRYDEPTACASSTSQPG